MVSSQNNGIWTIGIANTYYYRCTASGFGVTLTTQMIAGVTVTTVNQNVIFFISLLFLSDHHLVILPWSHCDCLLVASHRLKLQLSHMVTSSDRHLKTLLRSHHERCFVINHQSSFLCHLETRDKSIIMVASQWSFQMTVTR